MRKLSHYEIIGEISRGGMGIVYRAVDVRLNREVALKVLPESLVADQDRRRRFVQEAQAASALEHPHIAAIHEIDEADGVTFIAMELVRGDKLADVLRRKRLPPARALELATEIAEGVARAHDKNIAHRDLKPGNVMLTEDGHAKIIDFGLAKLLEQSTADLASAETMERAGTEPGVVLGTASYMSPEQAAGDRVDHRTDIFSFGVLVYEMLAGETPFLGRTGVDTLHAIINSPAPRLPQLSGVPAETSHELARMVEKCLAKDPDDRYQGMRDVVVDLRAVRRQLDSGISTVGMTTEDPGGAAGLRTSARTSKAASVIPASAKPRTGRVALYAAAAAAVLAVAAAAFWMRDRPVPPAGDARPSIAVLYFENNTGNTSLDWLRTGLTDMVVTDLSQLPDIDVLATDRLHRILNEMRRADDRVISADVVDALAERAGVETVLLGSYVKAGDAMRINLKLQEAKTGRIITAERVDGAGESEIFTMIDELTRRIRNHLLPRGGAPPAELVKRPGSNVPVSELDRGLEEVTTSSVEAYRYYSEGIDLHQRLKEQEAIPKLQKAVEIDPEFAMALAKLAVIHGNLQLSRDAAKYSQMALDRAAHLTPRERMYVEAVHYSRNPATSARAVDTYQTLIRLYPDHEAARNNLGVLAVHREDYDEAITQLEGLRRLGGEFPSTYAMLASSYARKGDFPRGVQVLEEYIRRFPANGEGPAMLSGMLVAMGRLDEGLAAAERGRALGAQETSLFAAPYAAGVLRKDWRAAEAAAQRLIAGPELFGRLIGWFARHAIALYRGNSSEAQGHLGRAVAIAPPILKGLVYLAQGDLHMDRGELGLARKAAEDALADVKGSPTELEALAQLALTLAVSGEQAAATEKLSAYRATVEKLQHPALQRALLYTEGEVALARRDAASAIDRFTKAEATLRPRPTADGEAGTHVTIWYALAQAHLAAGDRNAAARWFQKIVDNSVERIYDPVRFVRSHYFLAQIADQRRDTAKAKELYARFVEYWGDGDMDRERVSTARAKR